MQTKVRNGDGERRRVWILFGWVFLIFFTSCFFVSIEVWVGLLKRIVPIPAVQGVLALFWYHCGIFVVKGWHATEYAILASLLFLTLRTRLPRIPALLLSLCLAATFAATDEWHQTFVQYRDGCLRDVLIDTTGATLAMLYWGRKTRPSAIGELS
ncbi:MAG: VanZ family protein [Capsulimonas sp.]|uniref:VanZ family protein n=1 Tax=Capsulimonas sp. TaxID=2494211 RepID=UPI0032642BF1